MKSITILIKMSITDFPCPSMSATDPSLRATVETLYQEHHPWLRGWLQRKLGDSAQAADLAQDTFVRLLLPRAVPQDLHSPRAYLLTIARSLLINHWRRRDIERACLDALAARAAEFALSPEDTRQIVDTLVALDKLLHGLGPQVQHIFLLSQLDGLTYPEIARRLGLSVSQVQRAMTKAIGACFDFATRD